MAKNKEIRPITFPETAALLHGILFSYEKVVAEFYKGKHKILFPYIMEEMTKVFNSQEFKVVDPDLTFTENVERLRAYLSNDELLKGVSLEKTEEDTYALQIEECSFAIAGVHDILELHGGVCPFALSVAAILTSVMKDGAYIDLGESEYTDKGSKTILKKK